MTARVGFCCKYLHPDQTMKPKLLEEIQISEKRKLGKILSARIYNFLFK